MSNEHDLISGPAEIVADPRSNRILIVTRPVNLPFLEGLIAQLDHSDTFMQPQRRPLKYVLAPGHPAGDRQLAGPRQGRAGRSQGAGDLGGRQ